MVVSGVSRATTGAIAVRRPGAERAFQVGAEPASHTDAAMPAECVSVTSLLALQEAESGLEQDRQARQHGEAVVDALAELQLALLGADGPDLERLGRLLGRPVGAADPALAGVLRAVQLRARIELARRQLATSG